MRNHIKKLLSLLLVLAVLAGSLTLTLPALANESQITLKLNGGALQNTSLELDAGDALPTYENITRAGLIFGGWYTSADLSGSQCFTAQANTTYYAKWIAGEATFEDFEAETLGWTNLNNDNSVALSLNSEAANVYGGEQSVKLEIANKADVASASYAPVSIDKDFNTNKTEQDGIYFWINSLVATDVMIHLNASANASSKYTVSVPAGKSIVTVPWSVFQGYLDTNPSLWRFVIRIALPTESGVTNTVYLDDIGFYGGVEEYPVTFNTNGGSWVGGYAAPERLMEGEALPNYEKLTKAGAVFGGWYTAADLSGAQSFTATANTTYHARWIINSEDYETFDAYTDTAAMETVWNDYKWPAENSSVVLNTDSAHSYSEKSAKIMPNVADIFAHFLNQNKNITVKGEGVAFCVETTGGANIKLRFNNVSSRESVIRTVPAGKHFITVPWSEINGADTMSSFWALSFLVSVPSADDCAYFDCAGTYTSVPVPSYGVATPRSAGLFVHGDKSENAGITGTTQGSAVYEADGAAYAAFRVFGTYVAPDNGSGAPDYGKIVVDAEGSTKTIVSRHVMLGYGKEPTLTDNYTMSDVTADFENCWDAVCNADGTWTVTYSLLLKNIPEQYKDTAFYANSAVVTADATYTGEAISGVSAQAVYDAAKDSTIGWF